MSLTNKLLYPTGRKFSPANSAVNWQRIETLVHGPGAAGAALGNDGNSAVFACLMTICTSFVEPPLLVYRHMPDGKDEVLEDAPIMELLRKPTPDGALSLDELLFWKEWALHTDGNAYFGKVRSGDAKRGNVIQLWPVSPTLIAPVTEKDSDDWISYYRYEKAPGQFEDIPVENIIHFRLGLDDRDMRLGISPLKRLVREIATDDEASKFTDTLLRNYAIPGLVVTPAQGGIIDKDAAETMETKLRRRFSNDNRGNIAFVSKEVQMQQFGFSPEQMNLRVLHLIPEERISAVMGVPAILAGLGAGLERATYANALSLREFFTEQKLTYLWRSTADRLTTSLLPDFTDDADTFLAYDLSGVRALQEDQDKLYTRLNVGVQGQRPWITKNEARVEVGLPPVDGGDELPEAQEVPDVFEQRGMEVSSNGHGYPFRGQSYP